MKARINIDSFQKSVGESQTSFFNKEAKETSYGKKSGLNEIGRIRVGEMKSNNNGASFPSALDYFKVDTIHKMVAHEMAKKYTNQPKTLPVFFHTNDIENHCIESLKLRDKAGKLIAYGDGETFHIWNDARKEYIQTDTTKRPNIAAEALEYARKGINGDARLKIDWEHILTLRFCIKDVAAVGFWQFETKAAKTTIVGIRNMIDQCIEIWGRFAFLPFFLSVKMAESNTPGIKRKYPIVELTPSFSLERGLQLAEFLKDNEDFRPANLALMDVTQDDTMIILNASGETIKLLSK